MIVVDYETASGGGTDCGTATYSASATTDTINSKTKASAILCYVVNGANFGVVGAVFDSNGTATTWWLGDTYNGGRFYKDLSGHSWVQNADNTISYTHGATSILGGGTINWVIIPA